MILGVFTAGQDELARLHTSYDTDRMRVPSQWLFSRMAERSPDVPSFTQACTRSAIRSSSELLLATLLPHRQHVEMTSWVRASLSWKNAWGWSSTVCSACQPKAAKAI